MNMFLKMLSLLIFMWTFVGVCNGHVIGVKYLSPGIVYDQQLHSQHLLSKFCYRGVSKHFFHIWQTVYMWVNLQPENYKLYHGRTPEEVDLMYESHKNSWAPQLFTWKSNLIRLDPFNQECVGIETSKDYSVAVNVIRIDFWKVFLLLFGIGLFLTAHQLSSNPVFYYICGVTLGITTSILIAFYLMSKLIPRKPAVYGFLIGGWTIGIYLFQVLWNNIKTIALNYQSEVLTYVLVTGLISFVICYRFGPVTDSRSKNLIKWALQCASLTAIFYSSHYQELSVLIILALLLYYNFPTSWSSMFLILWKKRFPPKMKCLTEDEYHEQGARETVKALNELRKYCSSPECKQWKTVLSLREPIRFAEFVEGNSHLTDSEILEYEAESRKSDYFLTDDSDTEFDNNDEDEDDDDN